MSRERGFGRAHRPDMKVVHLRHVRQAGEILPHFADINSLRHGVQGEIDGVAEQPPGAEDNHRGNRETDRRIDPLPPGGDDEKAGDHHTQRNAGISGHVHEGGANVEVTLAPRHEHQGGCPIDADPNGRNPDNGVSSHRCWDRQSGEWLPRQSLPR